MFKIICCTISLAFGICTQAFATEDSLALKIAALWQGDKNSPGFTIGIIDQGKLVFQQGYGMANISRQLPNGPAVSYKVASLSKQFTAAAVVRLVSENKLALEDDIRSHLPDFPDYGHLITVADLLYHTSGIRDYMVLMWLTGISFEDKFTNEDALALIKRQKELNFIPKKRCVYSNSNYILLAAIVQKVTGKSLAEYTQQQFFSPMKLQRTGFRSNADAVSYSYEKNPYKNTNQTYGDGGLTTTLNDLLKWDATFYDSTSIQYKLLTLGKLDNGNPLSYGMGIMTGRYMNEPVQMHAGAFLGYRAELLRFPGRKVSIVCLGNSEEINPESLARQIADIYLFNAPHPKPSTKVIYDQQRIPGIVGKYEIAPGVAVDVKYEHHQLTGQATGQPKHVLYPVAGNIYRIGETGDSAIFEGNQLIIAQQRGRTPAQKLEVVTDNLEAYTGDYYNAEQRATYSFFIKDQALWFKVGSNLPEQCRIWKKYNSMQFSYKGLETATIEFAGSKEGRIEGFKLRSGRIEGLLFTRK